jgi:hypothetical protein
MVSIYLLYPQGGRISKFHDGEAVLFSADFLNAFNHVVFNDPTLSMQDPASFGVISSQANNPRALQFGLRLEF